MIWRRFSRAATFAAAVLCSGGTAVVLTQGAAGPFGVADATARKLIVESITVERLRIYDHANASVMSDLVPVVWRAYDACRPRPDQQATNT